MKILLFTLLFLPAVFDHKRYWKFIVSLVLAECLAFKFGEFCGFEYNGASVTLAVVYCTTLAVWYSRGPKIKPRRPLAH